MPAFTIQVESAVDDGMVTVHVAGTIADATAAGLLHPNCRHSLSAYLPGATKVPTNTADPAGDAARQRLRELERKVRKEKLKASAAIDPVAGKAHAAKARALQGQIREHVDANEHLGVFRKPERERPNLGFTPAGPSTVPAPAPAAGNTFNRTVATVESLVSKNRASVQDIIRHLEGDPAAAEVLAVARRATDPRRLVTTLRTMRTKRDKAVGAESTVQAGGALDKKTVVQLKALAKEQGIKLSTKDRKADIIAKLQPDASTKAAKPPSADGLDEMQLHSLRGLAAEFEIKGAGRLSKAKLVAALRREGAMSPEARRRAAPPAPKPVGNNPAVLTGAPSKWQHALTDDTGDTPVPVKDFVISGYTVKSGKAYRYNGITYLIEDGVATERVYPGRVLREFREVHASLPPEADQYQRGYAWLAGRNPRDAQWEIDYGIPGFTSLATAGDGAVRMWKRGDTYDGPASHQSALQHEFGHNVSTAVRSRDLDHGGDMWNSAVFGDRAAARLADFTPAKSVDFPLNFAPRWDRPFPHGVTEYGTSSASEDYAESMSLYLQGQIGTGAVGGRRGPVYFRDLFPGRARVLDQVFPEIAKRQLSAIRGR